MQSNSGPLGSVVIPPLSWLTASLLPSDADGEQVVSSHDEWARLQRRQAHAHETVRARLHPALWPQP